MKIRIALAEDNRINRNTFLEKTALFPDLEIVFVAVNGEECLEHLKKLPPALLPRVIFMDLEMPEMNGVQAITIGKALNPDIHFIVLTVFDDDDKIFDAIRAGASGYLMKHEPAETLMDAVRSVLEDEGAPMSPAIARKALNLLRHDVKPNEEKSKTFPDRLSEKETIVLEHLVNGWDAKRSASVLNISVLTVRKHIYNIYGKLHVNSKAQAIHLAHSQKWFEKK